MMKKMVIFFVLALFLFSAEDRVSIAEEDVVRCETDQKLLGIFTGHAKSLGSSQQELLEKRFDLRKIVFIIEASKCDFLKKEYASKLSKFKEELNEVENKIKEKK